MTEANAFICTTCGTSYPPGTRDWRCACGGLFDLQTWPALDAARTGAQGPTLGVT